MKLGFDVSESTVSRYLPRRLSVPDHVKRWMTSCETTRSRGELFSWSLGRIGTSNPGLRLILNKDNLASPQAPDQDISVQDDFLFSPLARDATNFGPAGVENDSFVGCRWFRPPFRVS